MNPTLSDLIGGIQTVTLGDEEARRRRTQKSILERKAPPTFQIIVEIQERDRVTIHPEVSKAVDAVLRGQTPQSEVRWIDDTGEIRKTEIAASPLQHKKQSAPKEKVPRLYLFGINRSKLEEAARERKLVIDITATLGEASLLLTTKNYYRRKPQKIRDAEASGIPIHAIKSNNIPQLMQCLDSIYISQSDSTIASAMNEAQDAIIRTKKGKGPVELSPQNAYIRRLQHLLAESSNLSSRSLGKDPERRVKIVETD